jgi:hypothetical protein
MRRTVMIDQKNDYLIRKVWAELVRQGYKASYSKALNIILTVGIYRIFEDKSIGKEALETFAQEVIKLWKDMGGK